MQTTWKQQCRLLNIISISKQTPLFLLKKHKSRKFVLFLILYEQVFFLIFSGSILKSLWITAELTTFFSSTAKYRRAVKKKNFNVKIIDLIIQIFKKYKYFHLYSISKLSIWFLLLSMAVWYYKSYSFGGAWVSYQSDH